MLDSLGDPSRRLQGVRNGGKSDNKNHGFTALKTNPTWRIIPVSKWLITMVSKSLKWGYSPYKWPFHGL